MHCAIYQTMVSSPSFILGWREAKSEENKQTCFYRLDKLTEKLDRVINSLILELVALKLLVVIMFRVWGREVKSSSIMQLALKVQYCGKNRHSLLNGHFSSTSSPSPLSAISSMPNYHQVRGSTNFGAAYFLFLSQKT